MKKRIKVFATFGTLILLVAIFFLITNTITKTTGYSITPIQDKSDFEICLEEQYIVLYINTADSTKTLQQIELKEYLEYTNIINCQNNNQPCIEEQINNFPTWIINEHKTEKDISFPDLITFSGCRFTK